jgi:hypothetical protein
LEGPTTRQRAYATQLIGGLRAHQNAAAPTFRRRVSRCQTKDALDDLIGQMVKLLRELRATIPGRETLL